MVAQNCSVSHILQNILLCVRQNKDIHTGLKLLDGKWQNFHFWVNYPFKKVNMVILHLCWLNGMLEGHITAKSKQLSK